MMALSYCTNIQYWAAISWRDKRETPVCYSARIEADYRKFVKEYGAIMSLDDFTRMIMEYFAEPKRIRLPKAMTAPFL